MPLRSVEAATRDDAIAAAREQFGPTARVVGVRRVRSGGVLGFFATERYVAEVASDPAGRPAVPVPATSRSAEAVSDESPSDFSSPLASATPARARAAAPARNGAAAWAAEAARTARDLPASSPASSPAMPSVAAPADDVRPAEAPRPSAPARTGSQPAMPRADQERVSELAGLLAGQATAPEAPDYSRARYSRAEFQRTGSTRSQDEGPAPDDVFGGGTGFPAASAAPSPFTAALARMVAGDRDVRQAVREALDDPAAPRPGSGSDSRPIRPGAHGPADTSVASPATRQKEETVGDQVIAPSTSADQPAQVPAWAAAPEVPAPSTASREEAIAEVLRAALAQGHSDEALAGILRKVLAGVSPQTALAEPEAAVPVRAVPELLTPAPAPVPVVAPVPVESAPLLVEVPPAVVVPPVVESAVPVVAPPGPAAALFPATPVQAPPVAVPAPAPLFAARGSFYAAPVPFAPPPLFAPPVGSMWGDPSPAPLWGAPVTVAYSRTRPSDEPIWAEISQPETAGELADAEDTPVDVAGSDVVHDECAAAEASAAEIAASEAAEAAAAEAAAAEAAAVDDLPVDAALESFVATPIESVLEHQVDVGSEIETTLAEQVEEALAELSADESVREFLAEADAEKSAETEADVEIAAVVETEGETAVEPANAETETAVETEIAELAPMMARTASDPAPMMSLDATTVMPPLSLLPPLPSSRGRGRPPVPPASRPLTPRGSFPAAAAPSSPAADEPASPAVDLDAPVAPVARSWATVTRLPVAPLMATLQTPEMPGLDIEEPAEFGDALLAGSEPQPAARPTASGQRVVPTVPDVAPQPVSGELPARLEALGLPGHLLGATFADDIAGQGTYAALTRALSRRLPAPPELPSGAGEVLFVVGPGVETLRAARGLAASLRLDRDSVQWATRGELAGLAPKASRMTTVETAMDRRQDAAASGTVTIVAVDVPLRSDSYWMSQMLAIWTPTAVWVVVEATRKPEDLEPWIDGLPRVDALVVTDTDLSADPAAVLRRVAAPVAIVDGVRATPHRWASLLCERLETTKA